MTRKGFEGRIWELVTGHITLERIAGAMLSARATLKVEYENLHKIVLTIVREDAVCRRLMTVPSVAPIVAITYKSVLLARITRFSKLKRWGMDVAKRRGSKRAKVALARKIAVILHRMWDGTTYRWTDAQTTAVQV